MSWSDDGSGIPPAAGGPSPEEDLFVFGYGCKIFRDDEKAQYIEDERHLIPWMGLGDVDERVLIDRYDGRGHLMDLRQFEPPHGGANFLEGLSKEELEIERLCDLERYKDFDEDAEYDDNAYQEADFKKLQLAVREMETARTKEYGAVSYSYSDNPVIMGPEPKKLHGDIPYSQPSELTLPEGIRLPTTMKSHAIMEKTAKFIASHGTQMEIILKTKQAKNPQFNFLSHDDEMNPYYKFLVEVIKSGVYKPPEEIQYGESEDSDSQSDESDADGYLHPSLLANKKSFEVSSLIPQGSLRPSSNSAYSMLVSKIKESSETSSPKENSMDDSAQGISTFTNSYQAATPMPPPQDQLIIDKMATYVVKNGEDFETLARAKGDPRFAFLNQYHPYNWYYLSCKEKCKVAANAVVASKSFVSYKDTVIPAVSGSRAQDVTGTYDNSAAAPKLIPHDMQYYPNLGPTHPTWSAHPQIPNSLAAGNSQMLRSVPGVHGGSASHQQSLTCGSARESDRIESGAAVALIGVDFGNANSEAPKEPEIDEEEAKRIKEERRKKAALFLQRIKKSQALQAQAVKSKQLAEPFPFAPSPEREIVRKPVQVDVVESSTIPIPSERDRDSTSPEIVDVIPAKVAKDRASDRLLGRKEDVPRTYAMSQKVSKKGRVRGATWTDDEVQKLLQIWSDPCINEGLKYEKNKREVFASMSSELKKLNVNRSWSECRAKVKNLKGEFKKASDLKTPASCKFYATLDSLLSRCHTRTSSISESVPQKEQEGEPVQIEFEILSTQDVNFESLKSVPVELLQDSEGNLLVPPPSYEVTFSGSQSGAISEKEQLTILPTEEAMNAGQSVYVISSNVASDETGYVEDHRVNNVQTYRLAYDLNSKPNAQESQSQWKTKDSVRDISRKRKRILSLSEKISEAVERVLTKTTKELIEEFKSSENRFFEWEEKRRETDREREEKLVQDFLDVIKLVHPVQPQHHSSTTPVERSEGAKTQSGITEEIVSTFDSFAGKLNWMLKQQEKQSEETLRLWERKMQEEETRHDQTLFSLITCAMQEPSTSTLP